MKRIITAAAAAGVLVFGMSGCGSAEQQAPDHNASTPSPADTASPDNDNANDAAPEPTPDPVDMSVAFGQTQTWQDNVSVTVKKPTEFARGEWTMGGEGYPHLVKFDVTVTNGSDQPVDVSLFDYQVMSNGVVGETDIIDDDAGVNMAPNASVMPGKSMTFTLGAGVKGLNNLSVLAAPNWDYEQLGFGA